MKKLMMIMTALLAVGAAVAAEPAATATVTVDLAAELGPVKPMNCVNNGPLAPDKSINKSNFHWYRLLRIPYARTHDASFCASYGGEHCVDILAVFPDFDADENDPASSRNIALLYTRSAVNCKGVLRLTTVSRNFCNNFVNN